jgi:hypothetical protein
MGGENGTRVPVTYEHYSHVEGPFFPGTGSAVDVGDELVPGYGSNFQDERVSNHIYFTALVKIATWGAELATALAGTRRHRGLDRRPDGPQVSGLLGSRRSLMIRFWISLVPSKIVVSRASRQCRSTCRSVV